MRAYDIEMLTRPTDRAGPGNHGWCFGLPPGISPAQWPLDRNTGHPLQHGFTLLLPDDYRVHGPELVAVSFFATAHNDGGSQEVPGICAALESASPTPPDDPDLLPFWRSGRDPHPRLFRMRDILDCDYAAIRLTQAEFDGALCWPPVITGTALLGQVEAPRWLQVGSAAAFWGGSYPHPDLPVERDSFFYKLFGEVPEQTLDYHRALRWTPRQDDPNAGKIPCEPWQQEGSDYEQPFYWADGKSESEKYRVRNWTAGHRRNHIGGTMQPTQGVPQFSPYYVEFEEYLGGYNFGADGNAQLDLKDMKFDWACG